MTLQDAIGTVLAAAPIARDDGTPLGQSREGRDVLGHRIGAGTRRVSLLAGCHADEPVGPLLLRKLTAYLNDLSPEDERLTRYEWWIVPHINPDGEERNRAWYGDEDERYDIATYLRHVIREQPGDDIEFGFPHDQADRDARPENQAVHRWWHSAGGPFDLHISLHGMGFAAGPWFLVDAAWKDRCQEVMDRCTSATHDLGYDLHDVERNGEKGFVRIARGYTTRPDSQAMRAHFLGLGDPATADLFRPSSMESVRSLGGDTLTLVSEMPLFLTPGVGEWLGPPDPAADRWRALIDRWRGQLAAGGAEQAIRTQAEGNGLRPMPVADQMRLQLTMIDAGIRQLEKDGTAGSRAGSQVPA